MQGLLLHFYFYFLKNVSLICSCSPLFVAPVKSYFQNLTFNNREVSNCPVYQVVYRISSVNPRVIKKNLLTGRRNFPAGWQFFKVLSKNTTLIYWISCWAYPKSTIKTEGISLHCSGVFSVYSELNECSKDIGKFKCHI